jgi:hypothetical protein
MSPRWRRRGCVALLVAMGACYDTSSTRARVRIPNTRLDCVDTLNQVFGDAGYGRVVLVRGPNLFFTPLVRRPLGLLWGIGVWMESGEGYRDQGRCDFELQALSVDPGCFVQCDLTPQPGADYDRAVQDMGRRLSDAFGERRAPE